MSENPLYKKAFFQCARRAILENEEFMKKFIVDVVKDNYNDEKLERFNTMLTKMYDNDLFDLIMGVKKPDSFKGIYEVDICEEIEAYSNKIKNSVV